MSDVIGSASFELRASRKRLSADLALAERDMKATGDKLGRANAGAAASSSRAWEQSARRQSAAVRQAEREINGSVRRRARYQRRHHLRRLRDRGRRRHRTRPLVSRGRRKAGGGMSPADTLPAVSARVVRDAVVRVHTAQSQSRKAMGGAEFQASKTALTEWVAGLLGVAPETLGRVQEAA